jgi:hypothetical protein
MRNRILLWIPLLLVIHMACSQSDRALGRRIAAEARKGSGTLVRLASLTDFSWERLHAFGPYASQAYIDRELGFSWPEAARTGIAEDDAIALLVFVSRGDVVRYVAHPRNEGDFADVKSPGGLSPSEAVFIVHMTEDHRPVFQLEPEGVPRPY